MVEPDSPASGSRMNRGKHQTEHSIQRVLGLYFFVILPRHGGGESRTVFLYWIPAFVAPCAPRGNDTLYYRTSDSIARSIRSCE